MRTLINSIAASLIGLLNKEGKFDSYKPFPDYLPGMKFYDEYKEQVEVSEMSAIRLNGTFKATRKNYTT